MAASAPASVPRETTADPFDGLVQPGETLDQAFDRITSARAGTKVIGSDAGQRLLEAINSGRGREVPVPSPVETFPPIAEALAGAIGAPTDEPGLRLEAIESVHALIPIEAIDVGPNVRVDIADLEELAASIKEHGVLQPIKVRPDGDRWVVVWGQRRYLAAKSVGLERIPALIDVDEKAPATLAIEQLVENLHRADLAPLDRARAMRAVVDAGTSQADLARELGLHPSTVANDLGLLEAAPKVQQLIGDGRLTPSHYKALRGLSPKEQAELAEDAAERGYSAHEMEDRVQRHKQHAEWQREQDAESRDLAERRKTHALEAVAKRDIPKDARIHVSGYWGSEQAAKSIAGALRKAGYTNVVEGGSNGDLLGDRADTLGCDCDVWGIDVSSYGDHPSVKAACVVRAHQDAKWKAEQDADAAARADRDRIRQHVGEQLAERLRGSDPDALRVILWIAFDWSLNDWVRDHKGDRKKPDAWAELAELEGDALLDEVVRFLVKGFDDRYKVRLDWATIAAAFGTEPPSPVEKPTPAPRGTAVRQA